VPDNLFLAFLALSTDHCRSNRFAFGNARAIDFCGGFFDFSSSKVFHPKGPPEFISANLYEVLLIDIAEVYPECSSVEISFFTYIIS
jgi:hypothetical protein